MNNYILFLDITNYMGSQLVSTNNPLDPLPSGELT